jgi:hypothetical protein
MNKMENDFDFAATVNIIATNISKIAMNPVQVKSKKFGALGLYSPKNFAFIRYRKSEDMLRVSTKKEWAEKAGVMSNITYQSSNGWWGEPHSG